MIYEIGTISTKANDPKITGKNTLWKNSVTKVSVGQIILIQSGNTIYQNSIRSVESDTQMTLSFPVPVALTDVKYVISITMIGSVSDGVNKATAMVTESYQLMMILNRLMTESGVIKAVLPDGTEMQLRTEKERDRLLDGKFDKTGGVVELLTVHKKGLQYPSVTLKRDDGGSVTLEAKPDATASLFAEIIKREIDGSVSYRFQLPKKSGMALVAGDFGIGEAIVIGAGTSLSSIIIPGTYVQNVTANATVVNGYPFPYAGTLKVIETGGGRLLQEYRAFHLPGLIASRSLTKSGEATAWETLYTTGNTTKDSNGNLKAASPIIRVFADRVELNDESEGVEMERLGIGHYLIKGVVGFNADGAWGINNGFVIPQDHNGKNMVLIDYEVRPDGDIEVFVFHQQNADMPERFQNKRIKLFDEEGAPVYFENYEPCDVPESRWIDMRVEMPPNSIYNQKQAEAQRLAKIEAERLAQEEAKRAAEEAERAEQEAVERKQYGLDDNSVLL
ncbi:pyocin knob domain-containing protein [Providencia rettgeri]